MGKKGRKFEIELERVGAGGVPPRPLVFDLFLSPSPLCPPSTSALSRLSSSLVSDSLIFHIVLSTPGIFMSHTKFHVSFLKLEFFKRY